MTVTIDATGPLAGPVRVTAGDFHERREVRHVVRLGQRAMIGTIRLAFVASPVPGDGQ